MIHYGMRLYTDKEALIHYKGVDDYCNGGKYDLANIPGLLACVVMDYLNGASYPGPMKARVVAGNHFTKYMLFVENNNLDVYCHVLRTNGAVVWEDHAAHRIHGVPRHGRHRQATGYVVRLCKYMRAPFHGMRIRCNRRDVPRRLAGITKDYLKNAPYPGDMHAQVYAGKNPAIYLIRLENDMLDVYCLVERCPRVEVQEPPESLSRPAPPPAKEDAA